MVKLTDGERLLAFMLADIIEHQKVQSEIDPVFLRNQLASNSDWALGWKYHGLFRSDEQDPVVTETADILSMFRVVESSIEKLSEPEKSELAEHHNAKFHGFDGNHDRHFGVAQTIIKDLERFEEFSDRYLNSHSQTTLPSYREMLARYNDVWKAKSFGDLTADDLRTILG
ncbi:MAG: YfbU family protein [Sphingobium phenoxybenzoativorans]